MRTEISIANHDRVTVASPERTIFGYVWSTVGGTLLLTTLLLLMIVYSSLSPARAEESRVIRGPGKGFYETSQLSGPAQQEVKSYLDATYVDCEFEIQGKCNLNARTDSVEVLYIDTPDSKASYALAFIYFSPDEGNAGALRLAVWRKQGSNGYELVAAGSGMNLSDPKAIGVVGQTIVLSGLTLGPDDMRCCLTDPTVYKVSFADGKLSVSFTAQVPRDGRAVFTDPEFPKDAQTDKALESIAWTSALVSETSARHTLGLKDRNDAKFRRKPSNALAMLSAVQYVEMAKPKILDLAKRRKDVVSGFDFSHNNYAGEAPFVFFHNGSEMMVFPDHGIIAYKQPKTSIADVVHETDILFSGKIDKAGVVGTAYVFKKNCPPLPYRVVGAGYSFDRKDAPPILILRGLAPVHAGNSCAVLGTMANGPNNVLRFESAGAYAEDAL